MQTQDRESLEKVSHVVKKEMFIRMGLLAE